MSKGIDLQQFHDFVVYPILDFLGTNSESARRLLLGTLAHESLGSTIDQILGPSDRELGPAIGLFQIEPATHDDLWKNFLQFNSRFRKKLEWLQARYPDVHRQLATNLAYATAVARMIYYRQKPPLPASSNDKGLAEYWKKWYNTEEGKGTVSAWLLHYTSDCKHLDYSDPRDRNTSI